MLIIALLYFKQPQVAAVSPAEPPIAAVSPAEPPIAAVSPAEAFSPGS